MEADTSWKRSSAIGSQRDSRIRTGTNPEKIGNRYALGHELGRGAFGAVYQALDVQSGKVVAIKQLEGTRLNFQAMQREIEFLKNFEHENIIKYIDTVHENGQLNIILEYMENGSLHDIIDQFGTMPETLAATYIQQVLNGLNFLHQRHVIHKDIKAANVLVSKDGTVKLADFGIASHITSNTNSNQQTREPTGSPYWMAPEAIKHEGLTTKSDIWSVGCTIIELLTGLPPWGEDSPITVVWKIVEDDIKTQFPPEISNDCKVFLDSCFTLDTNARPSAAELLSFPWLSQVVSTNLNRLSADEIKETIARHNSTSFKKYSFLFENKENKKEGNERLPHGMDFSKVKASIFDVSNKVQGPKTWTEYHIRIQVGTIAWRLDKRYSNFSDLHIRLKKLLPQSKLPQLPPKRSFGNLEADFIAERKKQLQTYLGELLQIPEVMKCKETKIFLIDD